jgi:hypothetical protein
VIVVAWMSVQSDEVMKVRASPSRRDFVGFSFAAKYLLAIMLDAIDARSRPRNASAPATTMPYEEFEEALFLRHSSETNRASALAFCRNRIGHNINACDGDSNGGAGCRVERPTYETGVFEELGSRTLLIQPRYSLIILRQRQTRSFFDREQIRQRYADRKAIEAEFGRNHLSIRTIFPFTSGRQSAAAP